MTILKKILYGDGKNISKRIYLSNFCSSMLYSVQSAILLLIVTRIGGLHAAGTFSIIYTVTQTLASLGSYSMRNFQVSDARNQFSFAEYYVSRIITCILMLIACIVYCIYNRADISLYIMILSWGIYRCVDGMEDVYHGQIQKNNRLDVASIANTIRIASSVFVFTLFYLVSKNLIIASGALTLASLLLFCILNRVAFTDWQLKKEKYNLKKVLQLLVDCFPIFFGAILYNYLVNAPKYAIDRNLDKETQAIFNVIFMPIFVINVLSTFVFKPLIVKISVWWNEQKLKEMVISIIRQGMIILMITLSVSILGYLFGCPVLSAIYGIELGSYRTLFVVLLWFGGISALGTFFGVILTIMRKQILIILGYLLAFLLQMFLIDNMIIKYQIWGAGYIYGLIMGVSSIFFLICIVVIMLYAKMRGDSHGYSDENIS